MLAKGVPIALLMKGTVLLALGFTSITNIFSSLIASWILINPTIFKFSVINLVISSILETKFLGIDWVGKEHAESPKWTPASSICSRIPAIKTFFPSEIASTSISFAPNKNSSIKIDLLFIMKFELK